VQLDIFEVVITKPARRDLIKMPHGIVKKLLSWVENVAYSGLREVRKIPGYHDEPLKGSRSGQRSIRLSKAYRAIYKIGQDNSVEIVMILEVNKHDY
jgi:proteic killer suppression protein